MALRGFPLRAQVVLGPALGGGAAAALPEACPGAPLPPGGIQRTMGEHSCTEFGPVDVAYEAASLTAVRQSHK